MISNYPSVLFVTISLLVCFHLGLAGDLKLLILSTHIIFKCPTGEFLVINDWQKFQSLNLSCPNQTPLSNRLLDIFQYGSTYSDCDAKNRTFSFLVNLTLISSAAQGTNNITDEQVDLLSSTVILRNHTYQNTPRRVENPEKLVLSKIPLEWNPSRLHIWYTLFDKQPISCWFRLNYSTLIANETCTSDSIKYRFICYYDDLSVSPLQNVNWTLLQDLIFTYNYLPFNWETKGAILYDPTLQITTTTTTTTSTADLTSSLSTDAVTTSSPDTTSISSTDEATTTDAELTSSSSTYLTSISSTDESTTMDTESTTSLTDSTSNLIIDTTSGSYTETTPITSEDSTLATTTDVTTIEIEEITSTNSKPVSKQVPKIKPAQRNSSASKTTRAPKKTSSFSSSLLFIFLLIIVICGIIGSVAFFVFRYYRKQHNEDDQLLLDRVDSNESNRSEMDESETSTVMDAPPEIQNEQIPARKAGRTVNRFDLNDM